MKDAALRQAQAGALADAVAPASPRGLDRRLLVVLLALGVLCVAVVVSIGIGPVYIGPATVVDALLGTGVQGALREPIRGAVELVAKARTLGIPIVAVDTPTAVDLSSGDPSNPVVQADLTVTFHRPKTGLLTRRGAALAGKVLVAPIGIPLEADRG